MLWVKWNRQWVVSALHFGEFAAWKVPLRYFLFTLLPWKQTAITWITAECFDMKVCFLCIYVFRFRVNLWLWLWGLNICCPVSPVKHPGRRWRRTWRSLERRWRSVSGRRWRVRRLTSRRESAASFCHPLWGGKWTLRTRCWGLYRSGPSLWPGDRREVHIREEGGPHSDRGPYLSRSSSLEVKNKRLVPADREEESHPIRHKDFLVNFICIKSLMSSVEINNNIICRE